MSGISALAVVVIVASNRPGRIGGRVAAWLIDQLGRRDDMTVDVIDLIDVELPPTLAAEPDDTVRAHCVRLDAADAFVVVTPEYNHGYPAQLKQAIDVARSEWFAKPVAFVGYGGQAGGMRAVEQLRQVFAELHATTIREVVGFHGVHHQFQDGVLAEPDRAEQAAKAMLDQLAWWATALRDARAARPYLA
ncbi:MAG: NADPH-dependent FMN reductase [Acidimicrobiales bacterium]